MAVKEDWLGNINGSAAEAKEIAKQDAAQRKAAEKSPKSVILNASDVSGNYDASRALETTLGGVKRELTRDDLIAFQENINRLKNNRNVNFKKGITARQVINMAAVVVSGKETDLKRSNREIKQAIPAFFTNSVVRFITNAGPDSDVYRHHVEVEFLGYKDVVDGTIQTENAKKAALWLCRQPLKFNCDCGRHRYWFRYVATIGQFNCGRDELGYPKIRNPGLIGVACKHVLKVMGEIESSMAVTNFLTRAIEKGIKNGNAKARTQTTQKEAEQQAKQKNNRKVKTDAEKATDAQKAKARREAEKAKKSAGDAAKRIPPPKKPQKKSANQEFLKQQAINAIKQLNLSPEIEASMIAQINAG